MPSYLEKNRFIPIIIAILIAIEIFYFSSLESLPQGPEVGINLATVYHFGIFFTLSFFFLMSLKGTNKIKSRHLILTMLIILAYAVSDEIHQLFVPGRFSSIKDILIDFMGILIAIVIYPKKK